MVLGIFKIALRLRDRHGFYVAIVKILNVFNALALKKIFWKMKIFCEKLECVFLVESSTIENAPYKSAMSEANVNTNRMVTIK